MLGDRLIDGTNRLFEFVDPVAPANFPLKPNDQFVIPPSLIELSLNRLEVEAGR
jgi:hypothetical protein